MSEVRVYNAETLAGAVRHFRVAAGLTQLQLAEQANVSRDAVIKLENGRMTEQVMHLLSILRAADARMMIAGADW